MKITATQNDNNREEEKRYQWILIRNKYKEIMKEMKRKCCSEMGKVSWSMYDEGKQGNITGSDKMKITTEWMIERGMKKMHN